MGSLNFSALSPRGVFTFAGVCGRIILQIQSVILSFGSTTPYSISCAHSRQQWTKRSYHTRRLLHYHMKSSITAFYFFGLPNLCRSMRRLPSSPLWLFCKLVDVDDLEISARQRILNISNRAKTPLPANIVGRTDLDEIHQRRICRHSYHPSNHHHTIEDSRYLASRDIFLGVSLWSLAKVGPQHLEFSTS